ncbi:uncharacterized protein [Clytia hemisphaerica]|uniref:uncharacterized protein n=1 Tax=Clytia hemisphaerica TaxID=252671 RepID=UPI0034D4AC47
MAKGDRKRKQTAADAKMDDFDALASTQSNNTTKSSSSSPNASESLNNNETPVTPKKQAVEGMVNTPSRLFGSPSLLPSPRFSPSIPPNARDILGFVGVVATISQNQARTRNFFTVHLKTGKTDFCKIIISNHKDIKSIRQKFLDAFHNKTAIRAGKLVPGKEVYFFNSYSSISDIDDNELSFGLNDADAVHLSDIDENGTVLSAVGKIKYSGPTEMKEYDKFGKTKTSLMRPCLFSDGVKTVSLSLWGDFVHLVRENTLIQLTSLSSKVINEEICLGTTYSSSICYLTADLDVEFPEQVLSEVDLSTKLITTPVIASVKVDNYWSCKSCQKRLAPSTQGMTSRSSCSKDFKISYLKLHRNLFKVVVFVEFDAPEMTVKLSNNILIDMFGSETLNNIDTEDGMNDLKLKLLNSDFSYEVDVKKKIVMEIVKAEES